MGRSGLFIEVSPSRMSLLRVARSAPCCLSQRLDAAPMENLWQGDPADIAGLIDSMSTQLGCDPSNPTVFYQSPTGVSSLFSCPTQVRDTTSAARMSLSDMAPFDIDSNPWSVQPIDRDRSGGSKRRHVVVCADTDEALHRLRECFDRAGATDATFVPIEAALLSRAVDSAIAHSKGAEPLISVLFGQSRSIIVAAHRQRLLLVRHVDFGTDRLADALAAAIEATSPSDAHAVAERLLFGFGLPQRGDAFEVDGRTYCASDILPAIQPALQRLVVEVRQSIRFGLPESDHSPNILISGSGAFIPRLDAAFGAELECPCVADGSSQTDGGFDIAHAADAWKRGLRVSLRERASSATAARNSLRNALYAGSAAAVLLGAGATALLSSEASSAPQPKAAREAPTPETARIDPEEASGRAAAVRATIRAVSNSIGTHADMSAALREICVLSADAAILTDIEITSDTTAAKCNLRGYVPGPNSVTPGKLRDLIDRYRESPLIARVRLENAQNSLLDDQTAQYFSAVIEFTSVPANLLQDAGTIADASGGRAD